MHSTEKEKICIQCEGRIPVEARTCPYCASDQEPQAVKNSFEAPLFQSQSLQDSLTSLYTPPYQGKRSHAEPISHAQESPPFKAPQQQPMYREVSTHHFRDIAAEEFAAATANQEEETKQSPLWPAALLIGGSNLLLLSLIQLFFSKGGVLHLQWNAHYWFLYLLCALPLLYFGSKMWKQLD